MSIALSTEAYCSEQTVGWMPSLMLWSQGMIDLLSGAICHNEALEQGLLGLCGPEKPVLLVLVPPVIPVVVPPATGW